MNKKIIISDFLNRLDFQIVPSSKQPNSFKHTAFALVTKMPKDIPVGKEIYFNTVQKSHHQFSVSIDIEPLPEDPDWFFVTRHIC